MSRYFHAGSKLCRLLGNSGLTSGRVTQRIATHARICPALFSVQRKYAQVAENPEDPAMFCFQCEQTKFRKGCTTVGVCGKTAEVAALQDLLIYVTRGLCMFANRAIAMGVPVSTDVEDFLFRAYFSTVTNVNFNRNSFPKYIEQAVKIRDELKAMYESACEGKSIPDTFVIGPAAWRPPSGTFDDIEELNNEGKKVGVLPYQEIYGEDVTGIRHMILYGIKGMATYALHASRLGERDPWIAKFVYKTIDFLNSDDPKAKTLAYNLEMALKVGETNLRVMELLDRGHRNRFGVPSPAVLNTKPKVGPAILVSGHDVADLATILEATKHLNINVYTHGEMMPAHGYPKLREYPNLAGHFGGAWQLQKFDFAAFPGPVVITTNCVIEPLKSYRNRLFTLNDCGLEGVDHLDLENSSDIGRLVGVAMSMDGFTEDVVEKTEGKEINVGYGREVILDNAHKVLEAAEKGELKRIFVIGGCDGAEHKRNYFTNLAESLPPETLVLTMGCAKYRIQHQVKGELGSTGIPRLLDLGQCNDSYGAIVVAKALADALKTDINSLPLSINLSWFEQKAVAVLLSLLSLGVKNIRLGPVLPAFITPTVQDILVEKFNLTPVDIRHPDDDLKVMMGE